MKRRYFSTKEILVDESDVNFEFEIMNYDFLFIRSSDIHGDISFDIGQAIKLRDFLNYALPD